MSVESLKNPSELQSIVRIDKQTFHVVSIVSLKNLGDLRVLC